MTFEPLSIRPCQNVEGLILVDDEVSNLAAGFCQAPIRRSKSTAAPLRGADRIDFIL
jgi:hypothetical protein